MNLIIDQGNTRTKLAIFNDGQLLESGIAVDSNAQAVLEWIKGKTISKALISSVAGEELAVSLIDVLPFPLHVLSSNSLLPFSVEYKTPRTLGLDRLALTAGAISRFPDHNCLVIDAGTCITYDFVNKKGEYLGGGISPGVAMRFKAMHEFTASLPLASSLDLGGLIGESTMESLSSGVVHGIYNEVEGTIKQYERRFPDVITFLTGGDLPLFDGLLKNTIFAAPELVVEGLNNILDYHAEML